MRESDLKMMRSRYFLFSSLGGGLFFPYGSKNPKFGNENWAHWDDAKDLFELMRDFSVGYWIQTDVDFLKINHDEIDFDLSEAGGGMIFICYSEDPKFIFVFDAPNDYAVLFSEFDPNENSYLGTFHWEESNQRCGALFREMFARAYHGPRQELFAELRRIFRPSD